MKRELIKKILHIIVTVITSVITTLGTTSCVVNLEPQTPPPQGSCELRITSDDCGRVADVARDYID